VSRAEEEKRLREMLARRAQSVQCPYINECKQKVLKEEAEMLCKDLEITEEIVSLHVAGNHGWQVCKIYNEIRREKEGKLPREW